MKTLIFGGTGMLGHKLVQVLGKKLEVWTTVRDSFAGVERFGIFDRDRTIDCLDINDPESVRRSIEIVKPDVVINAVGIIKQLSSPDEVIRTLSINSIFPHRLAELSAQYGFKLITISTDCVFNGKKGNYSEDDAPDAHDLYGMSKFLGEVKNDRSLTIRTSIIGRELVTSHSIVEWFLANRGGKVKGYTNAIYTGFPTAVLADIIAGLITDHPYLTGVYHISSDPISKFNLLELLDQYYQANVTIEPSDEVVIDRSLDSSKFRAITDFQPRRWENMIDQMASSLTPYDSWRS